MNAPLMSSRTITLRCSSLPLVLGCAGALIDPEIRIREDVAAADAGTAGHELLAKLVDTGTVPWDSVADVAAKHGADPDEVRMLLACGAKLWQQVSGSFVNARTEVEGSLTRGGLTLTGHEDVLAIALRAARVGDWKTGRKDSNHEHQLRGYASLVFDAWPELEEVTATALWVRDQEIENYTITRAQNERWLDELVRRVTQWDGVYHPEARRCLYCPRQHECPGREALVKRDVAAFTTGPGPVLDLASMEPAQVFEIYEKAEEVGKLAERVRTAIKQHVKALGDVEADGKRLTIVSEPHRVLDPLASWPVLESLGFTDADFAAVVKLGVTALEKHVSVKAGKGKGAGAVRVLTAQLEAANAVGTKNVEKLVSRRSA